MRCTSLRAAAPLFLLAALAPLAPLSAGSVYVPLAFDQEIEGVHFQTQIWATNLAGSQLEFNTHFIANNTDGTDRQASASTANSVPPGRTLLYTTVADGERGLLEISGAPELVITAHMSATRDGVAGLGAALPVIGSHNLFPAGTVAHLAGWTRDTGLRTDFGILNLGHQPASCEVRVLRSDGSVIVGTFFLAVKPLSQLHFDDALDLLGEPSISAVRSETTCNQPFYTYTRTYDLASGDVFLTVPSRALLDSTLNPPGQQQPGAQAGCAAPAPGYVCFSRPGTFFAPTPAESYRRENVDVPSAAYSRMRMRLDIRHGGWTSPTSGLHLAFWLARAGKNFDLYGFAGFRGPNRNELLFRHGMNMEAGLKAKHTRHFQPVSGQTYKIDFLYDPVNDLVVLTILDSNGNILEEIADRPNVNRIHIEPGQNVTADFSFQKGHNPAEPPSYGWLYQNLVIELFDGQ